MGRPRKDKKYIEPKKKKCFYCCEEKVLEDFWKSRSKLYAGNDNLFPICKECLHRLYESYLDEYRNRFAVLGVYADDWQIERLAVKRLCMMNDIYYSDKLFDSALKHIERVPNMGVLDAYIIIVNLSQYKKCNYDSTIIEENLSEELFTSEMGEKIRQAHKDNELFRGMLDLCLITLERCRGTVEKM